MKDEVERAKERATSRHKNTGKCASAMKGSGGLDVDQRREIKEMLERGEALRAKIHGDNGSDDDDDDTEGAWGQCLRGIAVFETRRRNKLHEMLSVSPRSRMTSGMQ
ncbi:hypothetical protein JB92DRAFT_3061329 [Gautieria morchelliformis]|nr:hypothetical protein JB92DRAFT_3061329 [Gautieria morchelliformis]